MGMPPRGTRLQGVGVKEVTRSRLSSGEGTKAACKGGGRTVNEASLAGRGRPAGGRAPTSPGWCRWRIEAPKSRPCRPETWTERAGTRPRRPAAELLGQRAAGQPGKVPFQQAVDVVHSHAQGSGSGPRRTGCEPRLHEGGADSTWAGKAPAGRRRTPCRVAQVVVLPCSSSERPCRSRRRARNRPANRPSSPATPHRRCSPGKSGARSAASAEALPRSSASTRMSASMKQIQGGRPRPAPRRCGRRPG